MAYPTFDKNPACKCYPNGLKATLCPYGHVTECHYPKTCAEAECGHFRQAIDGKIATEAMEPADDPMPAWGACCACGGEEHPVRTLVMLGKKGDVPGTGWGCCACGLPSDGALAVLCDICVLARKPLVWAVSGSLEEKRRVPVADLDGEHKHDLRFHPSAATRN